MLQLGEFEDTNLVQALGVLCIRLSNNNHSVVRALMTVIDELEELWEELSLSNDGRGWVVLKYGGQ